MYVVKRPFKNFGITLTAGSVIKDPAGVKLFKSKLAEGKIVEVTEQTFEQYYNYFKLKFGVELEAMKTNSNVQEPAQEQQKESDKQAVKHAVVAAKVVAN